MSTVRESFLMGLIGSGVGASLSPVLHEREADEQGVRLLYRPLDLELMGRQPHEVGVVLREGAALGFNAFNVTHPCKQLMFDDLDEVSPAAARIGAVNTVLVHDGRLVGHNTDCSGFAAGLAQGLPQADLNDVVQLGCGGAGAAVAVALLEAGVKRLVVVDPDDARAVRTTRQLVEAFPGREIVAGIPRNLPHLMERATGLVNASPVGMHLSPGMPLPVELLHPRLWVADVVYRPLQTGLVRSARALGCAVLDGGHMAVGQAVDTFRLVTGLEPGRTRMRRHFLDLVAAEN